MASKYIAINTSNINWKLKTNYSKLFILKSLNKFQLLNPYLYSKEYIEKGLVVRKNISNIKDHCLLTTSGIILKSTLNESDIDSEIEHLIEKLNKFNRYLRHESMQVGIHAFRSVGSLSVYSKIKKGMIDVSSSSMIILRSDLYHSSVTEENIYNVDRKIHKNIDIPIYEETLLEAIKSNGEHDYNKTILFSTISIESLLGHILDKKYEVEKSKKKKSKYLRFIKVTDHNGTSYKDPICSGLLDKKIFNKLLHEAPLYLLRKSILLENKKVYDDLLKLYATRNKIAHSGAPLVPESDKMIKINANGALTALQLALWVFNWLNIKRYDKIISRKHIKII